MSNNQDNQNNEPKLSHGLRIFIIAGTVFLVGFGIVYFAVHGADPEYFRTQIDPDSNLADKELIVKQDTVRKDTAAADSANKEEEEQAKKVFNSIRGNVTHKVDDEQNSDESDAEAQQPTETSVDNSQAASPEGEKSGTSSSGKQESGAPRVESVE